ncbi:MAG: hypothetical protein K2Y32_16790 [Candidatus Obscuribacterales bacterium]|nr:hypothetical protein [Candidatus Obscuribacterales bacterium]
MFAFKYVSRLTSLLNLRFGRALQHSKRAEPSEVENCFASLAGSEQEIVRAYFAASAELLSILNSISKRRRAVDPEQVLSRYELCEKSYIAAGFVPFMPGAINAVGLSSMEAEALDKSRLIKRHQGQTIAISHLAPVLKRRVLRQLVEEQVQVLDSSQGERFGKY